MADNLWETYPMDVNYRLPDPLSNGKGDMWSKRNTNVLNYQLYQEQKAFNWAAMLAQMDYNAREREAAQSYTTSERLGAQAYNTSEREAAQAYNTSEREAAQQFNLDMWNRSNEYNSPAAQAARLRAAGINPAAVINGAGSTAPVQSSPASVSGGSVSGGSVSGASASPASIGSAPSMSSDPYGINESLSAASRVLDSIEAALGKHEEIKGLRIDNETRAAKNQTEIENLIAQKRKLLADSSVSDAEKDKIRAEIAGLRISNYRNAYAASQDKKHESYYDIEFDKRMRELDNANKESNLRQYTQQLMNQLAIRSDSREAQRLNSDIEQAKAIIAKTYSEKGYIDKQAASEIVREQILHEERGKAETERKDANFDYQRKIDSFADIINGEKSEHLDHLLYYIGEAVGVPIKGIIRK